jgi:hypothetical protein
MSTADFVKHLEARGMTVEGAASAQFQNAAVPYLVPSVSGQPLRTGFQFRLNFGVSFMASRNRQRPDPHQTFGH